MDEPQYCIESPIPAEFAVGDGNVLVIRGWALAPPGDSIARFEVSLNGQSRVFPYTRDVRMDLVHDYSIAADGSRKLVSGFWLPIPVAKDHAGQTCRLSVALRLGRGDAYPLIDRDIAFPRRAAGFANGQPAHIPAAPLVVCMVTSDPDVDRFQQQTQALARQTYRDWICFVQDDGSQAETFRSIEEVCRQDPRFVLLRQEQKLGFERSSERCLSRVPPTAQLVALHGQDDRWSPTKLADMLARLEPGVDLVFSDMRVVDGTGKMVSPSHGASRMAGVATLDALLLGGDIPGTSLLVRNSSLQRALPFPDNSGGLSPEHWLACVATITGRLAHVEQPLYDHLRQDGALIPQPDGGRGRLEALLAATKRARTAVEAGALREMLSHVMDRYYTEHRQQVFYRQVLELRFADMDPDKRAALDLFADRWKNALALDGPGLAASLLGHKVVRPLLPVLLASYNRAKGARVTLATAGERLRSIRKDNLIAKVYPYWRKHGARMLAGEMAHVLFRTPKPIPPRLPKLEAHEIVEDRFPYLAPLPTYSIPRTRPRVNLVTDSINSGSLFGGVGTALIFAALLAERKGCDLRIITRTESPNPQNFALMMQLARISSLRNVEFQFADVAENQLDVDVGGEETFVTTSWWTTRAVMHSVAPSRIVYVLQEDERMFYPYGDDHIRCCELLREPDLAVIVNSKLLFDHLAQGGLIRAEARHMWFEPSFPKELFFADRRDSAQGKLRFLYYARPHNLRNLFFRGVEAIERAVVQGVLDPERWELNFVGRDIPRVRFGKSVEPRRHENLDWRAYAELIRGVDLGLSLMYTPHPSYPPLDLAASGAVVVTNRFANKRDLSQYSKNIICVDTSVEALVAGIATGVRLATDSETRRANHEDCGLLRDWRVSFDGALDALARRT